MLSIILTTVAGILVGYLLRGRSFLKHIHASITVTIWLMLFVLGLSVGGNPLVVSGLWRFGGEALLISVASVLGSTAAAGLVYRFMGKEKNERR